MSPRIGEHDSRNTSGAHHLSRAEQRALREEPREHKRETVRDRLAKAGAAPHKPSDRARSEGRARHAADPAAQQLRAKLTTNADGSKTFDAGKGNNDLVVRQNEKGDVTIRDRSSRRTYKIDADRLTGTNLIIDGGAGDDRLDVRSKPGFALINKLTIKGGAGDDRVDARGSKRSMRIEGNDGNDVLRGGKNSDRISGGNGNDRIDGGAGGDWIDGNAGQDTVRGSTGNDSIGGGAGADRIYAGRGKDAITADAADRRVDLGSDRDRDVVGSRDFNLRLTNVHKRDEVVGYNARRVKRFFDENPNVRLDGFGGDTYAQRSELARRLSTAEGRRQLDRISPDATIHFGGAAQATGAALARLGTRHVFFNNDGDAQELAIRDAGDRRLAINLRSMDDSSHDAVSSFQASFDEGVDPRAVLPSILNDYSETPLALRDSFRTATFHAERGAPITTTDDPTDFAGANATDGHINFFDGARNVSLFYHEVAHLFGQDAEGGGHIPEGYEAAARSDGNFTSAYAEDASSSTGYTEDFADGWEAYTNAIDDGTLDAFRRRFPARARFFEEQLARPRAPRADGTW